MFYIAQVTDKENAAATRRQLKKAGFSYNPHEKQWVMNAMTIRGARLALPRVREITGAQIALQTAHERHTYINEEIEKALA